MYRGIRVVLLSAIILLLLAGFPASVPGAATMGLSGSAEAQKLPQATGGNLNSAKSNVYRQAQTKKKKGTPTARAACEAKCREDHQGNAAALAACKRGCGTAEATGARTNWTCYEVCEFQCKNQQPCTRLCMKEC